MFRIADILVILFFLVISIVLIFKPYGYEAKKILLVIEQDSFYIPYKEGEYNLYSKVKDLYGKEHPAYKSIDYTIKDNKLRVIHSDCANQVCVNTPAISKCGEAVICAPNKVAFIVDCQNILKGSK